MHEFDPLDILLLPNGCKIFVKSVTQRWLGNIFRSILVAVWTCELATDYVDLRTRARFKILTQLSYMLRVIYSILFIIVVYCKREKMSLVIKETVTDLSKDQKSSLRRHAMICMMFTIAARILEIIGTVVHFVYENISLFHFLSDTLAEVRYTMNQWFMTGCFIHTFFVKIVSLRQENFFARVNHVLMIQTNPDDAILAQDCMKLRTEKDKLMSCLTFIPISWFAHIFIDLAATLMESSESQQQDLLEQITLYYPVTIHSAVVFYVIFQADSVSSILKKKIEAAQSKIMSLRMAGRLPLLMHELEKSRDSEFSAWNMFDINRRFVLSFISSLITFTVLFIQITKSAMNSRE